MEKRRFTKDFKLSVLSELDSGKSAAQLSREHNIVPSLISEWKKLYQQNPGEAFSGNGNAYTLEAKIAEYERLLGQSYAENALLKKALSALKGRVTELRKR